MNFCSFRPRSTRADATRFLFRQSIPIRPLASLHFVKDDPPEEPERLKNEEGESSRSKIAGGEVGGLAGERQDASEGGQRLVLKPPKKKKRVRKLPPAPPESTYDKLFFTHDYRLWLMDTIHAPHDKPIEALQIGFPVAERRGTKNSDWSHLIG